MTAKMVFPHNPDQHRHSAANGTSRSALPDLDSPEHIRNFVRSFYGRLLDDPVMAPVFLDVAEVDLDEHLPIIEQYWRKMLLGEQDYQRHTMARHRAVHHKAPLRGEHFERWLQYFLQTVDENYRGPYADRAKQIAGKVMHNLYMQLTRIDAGEKP